MPAPKPPRLGINSSPRELARASRQIAQSQRISVSPPLLMQQSPSGFQLGLDTSRDFFLARLTSVYTVSSGPQAGLNLYSFIEQLFDPDTGAPVDNITGRQTYPALTGTPTSAYAIEDNNTLLTVPGSTPTGFVSPGPYVEMRLKGSLDGVPVYEFFSLQSTSPPPSAFSGAFYTGSDATSVPDGSIVTLSTTGMAMAYDTDSYGPTLTVPTAGVYHGYHQIEFAQTVSSISYVMGVYTTVSDEGGAFNPQSNVAWVGGSAIVPIMQVYFQGHYAAGTQIVPHGFHNSGSTLNAEILITCIERVSIG